jgi:hypothetical protein
VVRAAVARMTDLPGGLPTLSIGLASTRSVAVEPEALLAAADRALYDAKIRGRDRVSVMETAPRRRPPYRAAAVTGSCPAYPHAIDMLRSRLDAVRALSLKSLHS